MKIKLFVLSLATCLELLVASGSARAQILLPLGGRGAAFGGGIYQPYNTGFGYGGFGNGGYGGYGGYGLNRFSNEGRSFTAPGYGFRNNGDGLGGDDFSPYAGVNRERTLLPSPTSNGDFSPYGGAVRERSYAPSPNSTGDPLLYAVFPPGSGVSGDLSSGATNLTRQNFYSGPATTSEKIEFHVKLATPDTKLYFNGNLVDQRGDDRWLGTVPLTDGGVYAYAIKATWVSSSGREVSYTKSLHAKPGQLLTIDFTTRASSAAVDTPK